MEIIIKGNVKQKKNDKRVAYNRKTGKPFIMTGGKTNDYISSAIEQIKSQINQNMIHSYPVTIRMTFFYGTRHRKDIDNSCSTILDCLKDAGAIEDDGFAFVDNLIVKYGGIDKDNPRTEIHIRS